MASGEHSYTRRAILGAAGAVLVVGEGAPVLGAGAKPSRALAVAGVGRAEARLRGLEAAASAPGLCFAVCAAEERAGEALSDFYAALRRLLALPAPDGAALAMKVALVVDHQVAELTGGDACMAALKADAGRLLLPA